MSPENRIQRRNVYEYKVKKEEKACNPYDKGARSMYLLIEKNLLIKKYYNSENLYNHSNQNSIKLNVNHNHWVE